MFKSLISTLILSVFVSASTAFLFDFGTTTKPQSNASFSGNAQSNANFAGKTNFGVEIKAHSSLITDLENIIQTAIGDFLRLITVIPGDLINVLGLGFGVFQKAVEGVFNIFTGTVFNTVQDFLDLSCCILRQIQVAIAQGQMIVDDLFKAGNLLFGIPLGAFVTVLRGIFDLITSITIQFQLSGGGSASAGGGVGVGGTVG